MGGGENGAALSLAAELIHRRHKVAGVFLPAQETHSPR